MSEAHQMNLLAHYASARRRAADAADREAEKLARHTDPSTSLDAAQRVVRSGRLSKQKEQVLKALRRWPGSTSAELASKMGAERAMPGRRLPDLEKAGEVHKCGTRLCEVRGTRAKIWRAGRGR